jgi:hypothetical protein
MDGKVKNVYEWNRLIQIVVDEIDERIRRHDDEALALQSLSKKTRLFRVSYHKEI